MHDDIEHSVSQVEALTRIARLLAGRGLVPYRCQYDFHSFGFWSIEAGTPHRRLRITRDGRERTLTYATARLKNAGTMPEWEEQEVTWLDITSGDFDAWVETIVSRYRSSGS